jgi:hypothetical protein
VPVESTTKPLWFCRLHVAWLKSSDCKVPREAHPFLRRYSPSAPAGPRTPQPTSSPFLLAIPRKSFSPLAPSTRVGSTISRLPWRFGAGGGLYSSWSYKACTACWPASFGRLPSVIIPIVPLCSYEVVSMPPYCLQDCHYFYRTALRLLSLPTCLASSYA